MTKNSRLPAFVSGAMRFASDVYPDNRTLFEALRDGQSPEALFITCADSRIDPALLTGTDPGQLFVLRNAGNIVPPWDSMTGGMIASIEFAVCVLNVAHIVICGHSGCGAMQGLMEPDTLENLPRVSEWLGHAKSAASAAGTDTGLVGVTERNIALQTEHLAAFPEVARRVEDRSLTLHGWYYDIGSGEIRVLDPSTGRFSSLGEYYA